MWTRPTIKAGTLWSCLTIAASLCPAQVFTANLTGLVTDPNQAVMPGVSVRIKNVATNEGRQTLTGTEGRYTFSQLLPGTYDVTAEFTGFRSVVQRDIALAANQSAELNFSMQVGDVTQTVEVKENTVALDTQTANQALHWNRSSLRNCHSTHATHSRSCTPRPAPWRCGLGFRSRFRIPARAGSPSTAAAMK